MPFSCHPLFFNVRDLIHIKYGGLQGNDVASSLLPMGHGSQARARIWAQGAVGVRPGSESGAGAGACRGRPRAGGRGWVHAGGRRSRADLAAGPAGLRDVVGTEGHQQIAILQLCDRRFIIVLLTERLGAGENGDCRRQFGGALDQDGARWWGRSDGRRRSTGADKGRGTQHQQRARQHRADVHCKFEARGLGGAWSRPPSRGLS
jgi:hypothetical protein